MAVSSQPARGRTEHTVEALTRRNVKTIARLEQAMDARSGRMGEVARRIAVFCGSPRFIWLHVLGFAGWIGLNSLPGLPHIDPFPFTFLTLIVSLEAIFLSAFILMSQNRAARIGELRNQLDLQLNLLTEQETTKLLRLVEAMADKMGVHDHDDPPVQALEQATDPERLAQQIQRYRTRV